MAEVFLPPAYRDWDGPVLFLAGPIQGAPDWQSDAISLLVRTPGVAIACPRRPGNANADLSAAAYEEQVKWEHHYLERAGLDGVLVFWLAREVTHHCDRAYAQTTRFELGEAVTLHRWKGIKVVVGIEQGFSGASYLKRTLRHKVPHIPLCSSLQHTCAAAARLAFQNSGTP
jgi:hypothetical protein